MLAVATVQVGLAHAARHDPDQRLVRPRIGQFEPIGEPCGLPHDIEMTIGDGIKGSRKKRGARHGGGLARALGSRKPSSSHLATGAWVAQPGILVLCHALATTIESEL